MKNLKALITEKGFVLGPFMKTSDPAFVEIAGFAGFDFVILDMEHGPTGLQQMQNLIRAARVADIVPVIRTRDQSPESVSQALDIGAQAVQIPQVTTAAEAEAILRSARFYPRGERGVCRFVRAAGYSSVNRNDYFRQANETLIILQIEGMEGLKNFDAILKVPGIDILFVGPYDLSQSMGIPGETDHPQLIAAIRELVHKAQQAGKHVGIFADTPSGAKRWKDAGVHDLSYSVDVGLFYAVCESTVNELRQS
jgi:4-hydroxy-2-oxoheptanedioate aldolase